jgi:hypothetical protein
MKFSLHIAGSSSLFHPRADIVPCYHVTIWTVLQLRCLSALFSIAKRWHCCHDTVPLAGQAHWLARNLTHAGTSFLIPLFSYFWQIIRAKCIKWIHDRNVLSVLIRLYVLFPIIPFGLRINLKGGYNFARFQFLTAVFLRIQAFWDVTTCRLVKLRLSEDRRALIFLDWIVLKTTAMWCVETSLTV